MSRKNFLYNDWRADDEEEPEERPKSDIMIFSKKLEKLFFDNRSVQLWGVVDDKSARDVVSKLLLLDADKPGEEIKFYINSPGGVVTSGMVIYDTMRMMKSPVSTICMGLAASMGAVLLAGGAHGKRYTLPNSKIMIHQPSAGFQGQASDIDIHARDVLETKQRLNAILAKHTGQTIERIKQDSDRDNFMTAEMARAYGLVDSMLEKRGEIPVKA